MRVRCPECGVKIAKATQFCAACGAPFGKQPSFTQGLAEDGPTTYQQTASAPAQNAGPPSARVRGAGLRAAAGLVAIAAAILIIWAMSVPVFTANGTSVSIGLTMPFALGWEPFVVAILGCSAGILLIAAKRATSLRWLATGMLLAFGTQTFLLFVGYRFSLAPGQHPGIAGALGMAGGLMLLAAGVLGVVSNAASQPHRTAQQTRDLEDPRAAS